MDELRLIAEQFNIYGDFLNAERYGSGHINDTYKVFFSQAGTVVPYIFQRINRRVFSNPEQVMANIVLVTRQLQIHQAGIAGGSRSRLTVVTARDGRSFYIDSQGEYWRAYLFIENARTCDVVEHSGQVRQAARAFGEFQKALAEQGSQLYETIPDFHNTPQRIRNLEQAIAADVCNRAATVAEEIAFVRERAEEAALLAELLDQGKLPLRVTHNDTKLNNVMLDDCSGAGVCVIDLDTVMPGLAHYDFGDMVRTGTSTAAEDERDLTKVEMRFEMFEAILRGYLESARDFLTELEIRYLPFAGKLITLEIGVRFLTDYLAGDVYFKTHREGHNLDRCRTQFKLVESIESQMPAMERLLNEIRGETKMNSK